MSAVGTAGVSAGPGSPLPSLGSVGPRPVAAMAIVWAVILPQGSPAPESSAVRTEGAMAATVTFAGGLLTPPRCTVTDTSPRLASTGTCARIVPGDTE